MILDELRAWIQIANCGGQLSYWRTPSGAEIDFVWMRNRQAVGIEVNASKRWKPEFARALRELKEIGSVQKCFAVYCGPERLQDGPVLVLPIKEFMVDLARGRIVP